MMYTLCKVDVLKKIYKCLIKKEIVHSDRSSTHIHSDIVVHRKLCIRKDNKCDFTNVENIGLKAACLIILAPMFSI